MVANDSLDSKLAKMLVEKDETAKAILDMKPDILLGKLVSEL